MIRLTRCFTQPILTGKNGPVVGDLASIFLLSLLAMFNPTLLAAVTVMLLLPNPKKLMFGYLLGAYLTSITPRPADRLLAERLRAASAPRSRR